MELNGNNGFSQYPNDMGTDFHAQANENFRDRDAMYKLIIRWVVNNKHFSSVFNNFA